MVLAGLGKRPGDWSRVLVVLKGLAGDLVPAEVLGRRLIVILFVERLAPLGVNKSR